jgi:hypothetical protein
VDGGETPTVLEHETESVRWLGEKGITPAAGFERRRAGRRGGRRTRVRAREPLPTRFSVFAPAIAMKRRRGEIGLRSGGCARWEAPVVKERAPRAGGGVGRGHTTDAGRLLVASRRERQRLVEYQSVSQREEWPNEAWPWRCDEKSEVQMGGGEEERVHWVGDEGWLGRGEPISQPLQVGLGEPELWQLDRRW